MTLSSDVVVSERTGTFHALVDAAVAEILRREPQYLSRFQVHVPAIALEAARYTALGLSTAQVTLALRWGLDCLAASGATTAVAVADDPVGRLLYDSMVDAYQAADGWLPLEALPPRRTMADVLAKDYDECRTASGCRYFVRRAGDHPLVLVNAIGIPLAIWTRFLGDRSHPFQVIVVESGSADLLTGDMHGRTDLAADAAEIVEVLDRESLARTDVLAWCNGGRVAVHLATAHRDRVGSVVLLSTTMMGTAGIDLAPSVFEQSLNQVFDSVHAQPSFASFFAETLSQPTAVDWRPLEADPAARAALLFRLPAQEHSAALLAPVSRGPSLLNYGLRARADNAYAMAEALAGFDARTLLVTGDFDDIINSELTVAALKRCRRPVLHAQVSGAGHYVHDLQYLYFRWLVRTFLVEHAAPSSVARVRVRRLEGSGEACDSRRT